MMRIAVDLSPRVTLYDLIQLFNRLSLPEEMMSIISECDHFAGDKMEEAKRCVAELDVDQDGRVSYPEFLLVWKYKN